MWKLRIEDDQSNRTVVSLVRNEYTIGRAEENSVRLTERNVSRRHAKLERAEDGWVLTDLDSYTGCYVAEQRVNGRIDLKHDSSLRIGDYSIALFDDALPSTLAERDAGRRGQQTLDPPKGPGDRLVLIEGPNRGLEFPLGERRLLVGRGEECDIALNDTSVSRVHADIERDESGRYRISDQRSSNGVRVNGMDIKSTTLYSGDVIELGDVQLLFIPKGQSFTVSDHPRAVTRDSGFWAQMSRTQRWLSAGVGVAALGGLLFWGFAPPTSGEVRTSRENPSTRAMEDARRHFQKGDLDAAHLAIQGVQADSNLRSSVAFRQIEAAWADDLLLRAEHTNDPDLRRQLLALVARAQTVDPVRRREADNRLRQLNETQLQPSDLPQDADAGALEPDTSALAAVPSPEAATGPKNVPSKPSARPSPAPPRVAPPPSPRQPTVTADPEDEPPPQPSALAPHGDSVNPQHAPQSRTGAPAPSPPPGSAPSAVPSPPTVRSGPGETTPAAPDAP